MCTVSPAVGVAGKTDATIAATSPADCVCCELGVGGWRSQAACECRAAVPTVCLSATLLLQVLWAMCNGSDDPSLPVVPCPLLLLPTLFPGSPGVESNDTRLATAGFACAVAGDVPAGSPGLPNSATCSLLRFTPRLQVILLLEKSSALHSCGLHDRLLHPLLTLEANVWCLLPIAAGVWGTEAGEAEPDRPAASAVLLLL